MQPEHKYGKTDWERRFLLNRLPGQASVVRIRRITDRYIDGTALRLREQREGNGPTVFKLTQKIRGRVDRAQPGLITSMYLSSEEFCVLAQLPGKKLSKTRYSVPPFGIDVFEGTLQGLILAEAEFRSAAEAVALDLPSFILHEVSNHERFTGGQLVRASRRQLQTWLSEYRKRLKRQ